MRWFRRGWARKLGLSFLAALALNLFLTLYLHFSPSHSSLGTLDTKDDHHVHLTCLPPHLDINHPSIRTWTSLETAETAVKTHHFKDPPPLNCGDGVLWVEFWGGRPVFNRDVVKTHGAITCSAQAITRSDDYSTKLGPLVTVDETFLATSDFLRVNCTARDGTNYFNFAATAPVPKQTERAPGQLSVYILGINSLSRFTFTRKLKKTYAYLRKRLRAAVLEGYNIVGDGTPQALIPILTGETEIELPNTRRGDADAKFCNVYPWVWDEYAKAGYTTMYAEDTSDVGTFQYRLKGFDKQPTDHYLRTLFIDRNSESGKKWLQKPFDRFCIGPEPEHKFVLRYGADFFLSSMKSERPAFGFIMHDALSHDDINLVQVADEDLVDNLELLSSSGVLNSTLLIILADHGHRFAALRSTHQGQMEERLPFVSIAAPDWWRRDNKAAWDYVLKNQHRLTSPFDLHPTLRDLLQWDKRGGVEGKKGVETRGRSLWTEVPKNRTCFQADIAAHWCTCLHWEPVDAKSYLSRFLAQLLVDRINEETLPVRHLCRLLTLGEVIKVSREVPNYALMHYAKAADDRGFVADLSANVELAFARFQLHIRTAPNDALYEATLAYTDATKSATVDLAAISRINRYDDQPSCIKGQSNTRLLNFCLCPK